MNNGIITAVDIFVTIAIIIFTNGYIMLASDNISVVQTSLFIYTGFEKSCLKKEIKM